MKGGVALGQQDEECSAPAGPLLHPHPPTVKPRKPGHEGKPEPEARRVPPGMGALAEGFEDGVTELFGNPGAGILDGDEDAALTQANSDPYRSPGWRVPNGVHEQVLHDPLDD